MTTLNELATEALKDLKLEWQPIKPLNGKSWNVGEYALAYLKITNLTGHVLRNVVVETLIYGSAAQYQQCYSWDGNGGLVGELEPGDTWQSYCAFLKGVSTGYFALIAYVDGEVVPTGSAPSHSAVFNVQPAP